MLPDEPIFACNMGALTPDEREAHAANSAALFARMESVQAVTNGYRFRLPGDADVLDSATAFIRLERLCCPFFTFGVEVESHGGRITLSLTGPDGVQPFILAELGHLIDPALLAASG